MKTFTCWLAGALLLITACGRNSNDSNELPPDFLNLSDAERVAYVMERAKPDSVARFICLAALGDLPGARIDSFPQATLYAYEHYSDSDSALSVFAEEIDRFPSTLPLDKKMKILVLAGQVDPQGIGYDLGLHYADRIRTSNMSPAEVKAELAAFRQAADSMTYARFLKGFEVVVKMDGGRDLPKEVTSIIEEIR